MIWNDASHHYSTILDASVGQLGAQFYFVEDGKLGLKFDVPDLRHHFGRKKPQ